MKTMKSLLLITMIMFFSKIEVLIAKNGQDKTKELAVIDVDF